LVVIFSSKSFFPRLTEKLTEKHFGDNLLCDVVIPFAVLWRQHAVRQRCRTHEVHGGRLWMSLATARHQLDGSFRTMDWCCTFIGWFIKSWDITSLGSVQVVRFFDVAARLSAGDGPIAALVGGSSCSIDSPLPHRTF